MILVTRPEPSALAEAARAAHELGELDMTNQRLIVNGVFTAHDTRDAIALARQDREQAALVDLPAALSRALSVDMVPLLARDPMGVDGLRAALDPTQADALPISASTPADLGGTTLRDLVDAVALSGPGIVMTMGKGGVGKTTISATPSRPTRRGPAGQRDSS